MNEDNVLPATTEGGGAEGAWLRVEYDAVRAIADCPDDLVPILTAIIRWYCGLPYADLKGSRRAIFDVLRNSQIRNVASWKKMSEGGRAGGLKSGESRRGLQGGFKGASSTITETETETETETKTETKTETEPKPKPPISGSDFDSGFDSVFDSVLKPANPGGASTRTGRRTSTTYDDLKENLVGGILKIIGKENDQSEAKAWHGLVIKATNAGRSRDEMVEAVYSWYSALKVDGEPQNRAAALNRHFCKRLGLT